MIFYERFAEKSGQDAAVAQSVERRIGSAEVTGPIPVSSFHARHEPCQTKQRESG